MIRGIAGGLHIAADSRWQPEEVVGAMGPHAAAGRWMPPMLDIALLKLPGRRAEQLLAEQFRRGMHEGHRILELIAEAVGAG